jgi:hypothetical protein
VGVFVGVLVGTDVTLIGVEESTAVVAGVRYIEATEFLPVFIIVGERFVDRFEDIP